MVDCEAFEREDFITEPVVFLALRQYFKDKGDPDTIINILSKNFKGYSQVSVLLIKWLLLMGVKNENIYQIIDSEIVKLVNNIFDEKNAELLLTDSYDSTINSFIRMNNSPQISNMFQSLFVRHPTSKFLQIITEGQEKCHDSYLPQSIDKISFESSKAPLIDIISFLYSKNYTNDDIFLFFLFSSEQANNYYNVTNSILFSISSFSNQMRFHDMKLILQIMMIFSQINNKNLLRHFILYYNSFETSSVSHIINMMENLIDDVKMLRLDLNIFLDHLSQIIVKRFADILDNQLFDDLYRILKSLSSLLNYTICGDMNCHLEDFLNFLAQNDPFRHFIKAYDLFTEIIESNQLLTYTIFYLIQTLLDEKLLVADINNLQPIFYLLDKIVSQYSSFFGIAFHLYVNLLEKSLKDIENTSRMNLSKMIIDRFIFLIYSGYVIPVIQYMDNLLKESFIDTSLIRYFILELDKCIEYINDKNLSNKISRIRSQINI